MTTELAADAAAIAQDETGAAGESASREYVGRRRAITIYFLIMCAFRDAVFITGPILVFRMDNSVKSGGIYGTALLFGGMSSFLVTGVLIDRLGWRRVALVSSVLLLLANAFLAATALGLLPFQRELDIAVLIVIFFCGSVFYLVPDVLINHLLRDEDRPAAYARSGSLFPAAALMITASLLFVLEKAFGMQALGLTIGVAAMLAAIGTLMIARLDVKDTGNAAEEASSGGVGAVLRQWLSGFNFIASSSVMRLLFVFNCCLALALAPHNVFITAILKASFSLKDDGVAVAQFALASVEVLAAFAFPIVAKRSSMRALALTAVAALVLGNGGAALVLFNQQAVSHPGLVPLLFYVLSHVLVFVGLTFAGAWIRMVRGKATPATLLGRTVGAMSTASQLFGLLFSVVVSVVGATVATHSFYLFCVGITALVGAPVAIGVARRLALEPAKGS